ncbi:MAG: PAS domain-containing protein [Sumerlaeia bacterium]
MDRQSTEIDCGNLKWALRCAQVGVWQYDLLNNRVVFDEMYYSLLGYEPGAFAATFESWRELAHADDLAVVENVLGEYRSGGRTRHSLRYRMRGADGEWHWVLSRGGLMEGCPGLLLGTHVDVTDQCRAEHDLREVQSLLEQRVYYQQRDLADANHRLSLQKMYHQAACEHSSLLTRAVEQAPLSVVIANAGGELVYANPFFYDLTGWTEEEVMGKRLSFLKSGHHPPEYYRTLWQTITAGKDWHGEFCNRRKDGRLFWESATISSVSDGAGRTAHFVAVKKDITQERADQRERMELREQVRQQERLAAIGQAVAGAAHSIRNILTSLSGGAHLLAQAQQDRDWAAAGHAFRLIDRSARRLNLLVLEMVDYSKDRPALRAVSSIHRLLNEAAEDIGPLAERNHIEVVVELADCPETWVLDRNAVGHALANLAINAVEAMETGGVLTLAGRQEGTELVLSVSDTGPGINGPDRRRVFEAFFSTKGHKGTGLGLANVREVAAKHGGRAEFIDAKGEGTAFLIRIPQ